MLTLRKAAVGALWGGLFAGGWLLGDWLWRQMGWSTTAIDAADLVVALVAACAIREARR
jgi:hypothetical protein